MASPLLSKSTPPPVPSLTMIIFNVRLAITKLESQKKNQLACSRLLELIVFQKFMPNSLQKALSSHVTNYSFTLRAA